MCHPNHIKRTLFLSFWIALDGGPLGQAASPPSEEEWKKLQARIEQLEGEKNTVDITVHGIMAATVQSLAAHHAQNNSRGTFIFQPRVDIRPSENDALFFKFGFAAGKGLKADSPFVLSPWAADTEGDVRNRNGRHRDYLLTAGYKRLFSRATDRLEVTGGLIDATEFIDENAFANDEFSQFMNDAFVNGANLFAPSYDLGGALQYARGPFSVNGVVMNVGANDAGETFAFYGLQGGLKTHLSLGEGNYRLIFQTSNGKFPDTIRATFQSRQGLLFSFDQEFGPLFAGWLRCGFQNSDAALRHGTLYSGGVNVRGSLWGRSLDNVGIGQGWLKSGNTAIDQSCVTEAYARAQATDVLALTVDFQWLRDAYDASSGRHPSTVTGWISGLRVSAVF